MANLTARTSSPIDFESEASYKHAQALFNPFREAREQALAELRKESRFTPDQWGQLDAAAGIQGDGDEELTADSTLQVDSWEDRSEQVLNEQFVQSTIVDQLISSGFGVNSSLARYVYISPLRNMRLEADTSMNSRSRSVQDLPSHGLDGVPLPLNHVDYEIDAREYQNAQAFGESFDDSVATEARRALNRKEARMLWDGWGGEIQTERGLFSVGGLNSDDPDKVIQSGASAGWQDPTQVLADIADMHDSIESQTNDVIDEDDVPLVSQTGAYLFVPRGQWGLVTREDYETAATDEPLIDRLGRKYSHLEIVPAPRLDDGTAIMMLADPRYFQIVTAQGVTNTSWDVDGGYGLRNKVLSSRVPFIRRQPDGIKGIVRKTGI